MFEVVMKIYQLRGYPRNNYFVKDFSEFLEIMNWMKENKVKHLHESSSIHGYEFSVIPSGPGYSLFVLKWL
jgi:hypothetical protein